jgi:hypothetical protein
LKRVFGSFNLQLVHHAKNLLAAEGIRAVVKNEMLSSAMGELPPSECQAELWILNESEFQKAQAILLHQNHEGPDWTCSCGETLGGQFTQCWRCGAYRA